MKNCRLHRNPIDAFTYQCTALSWYVLVCNNFVFGMKLYHWHVLYWTFVQPTSSGPESKFDMCSGIYWYVFEKY